MSKKLNLSILLLAIPIFLLSLGLLFLQSRRVIYQEAKECASSALNTSVQRIRNHMTTVETATNANLWLIEEHFEPDSLLAISRRIVWLNRHVTGCSITAEPDMFPRYGRYFSAYTIQHGDSAITQREAEYDYYSKPWYKTPIETGKACWIDPYDDYTEGTLSNPEIIASYCKPIRRNGEIVGVISTDLSLNSLNKVINTVEPPYPGAYFVLIGGDGRNFVHPDSTKIFSKNEYTDGAAGTQGTKHLVINGKMCHASYRPVTGTDWILVLVCPDSEIMKNYNQLTYLIIALIFIGLLVILWLSRRAVNKAISPLTNLLAYSQKISGGQYDLVIPYTSREDVIGQLQNSFATMQQSLNFHMGALCHTAEMSRTRNEELIKTTEKAEEAVRQKTRFIQNMSHQIRTPLNIIMGFAQVLRDSMTLHQDDTKNDYGLPEEELASITNTMLHNAHHLNRMVMMLFDSSDSGVSQELQAHRNEVVLCNELARECVNSLNENFPEINIQLETELPDDCCIHTSRLYLMRSIRELLYNSAKYSDGKHVVMRVTQTENTICFIVEDIGSGLSEEQLEMIFMPFGKLNDLSEGLGLGLPLAKRHAQGLGGDLTLDTTYQEGCRFILELPKL